MVSKWDMPLEEAWENNARRQSKTVIQKGMRKMLHQLLGVYQHPQYQIPIPILLTYGRPLSLGKRSFSTHHWRFLFSTLSLSWSHLLDAFPRSHLYPWFLLLLCVLMTVKSQSSVQMIIPEQLLLDVPEHLKSDRYKCKLYFSPLLLPFYSIPSKSKHASSALFSTSMRKH